MPISIAGQTPNYLSVYYFYISSAITVAVSWMPDLFVFQQGYSRSNTTVSDRLVKNWLWKL